MYYVHNLHFVAYARSMQGHRAEAVKAAKEMSEAIMPAVDVMPEMADAFLAVALLTRCACRRGMKSSRWRTRGEAGLTATWRYARAACSRRGSRGAAARSEAFEGARQDPRRSARGGR